MALGSTQSLTEMSTRNISWGKDCRRVGLTTLPHSYADCPEICVIGPVQGLISPYEIRICFTISIILNNYWNRCFV